MPATLLPTFASVLGRPSKVPLWVASVGIVLGIGYLDFVTGYEVNAVLFYSLPIFLMVWFGDRPSAVVVALLCALVWWWGDEASGHHYSEDWHQAWETLVRLFYFLVFVEMCSSVKARLELLERSRNLEQEIVRIREREQQRVGHELHDGVCQYFAAIGCAAGSLKRSLEKEGLPQAGRAGEIEALIMKGVAQTRGIARGLSPVEDDREGLPTALQELAVRSTDLLNLECTFECDHPAPLFDTTCATHLYRIAQESVSNASRHGKARHALIRLSANPSAVALSVTDDGIGLPAELPVHTGMGLRIMQYRARMMDAQFEILPEPGGGTTVRCTFPPSP